MYELKLTSLQQSILRLLFIKVGKTLNARAIANALDVSQPAVSKSLPLLEKKNLINVTKDEESGRLAIELKRDNPQTVWLKRVDNLKQIYESGLVQSIYDNFPGATVILFGSYAFGEDTLTSDVDIAIIGSKKKEIDLNKFSKAIEREIIINYYDSFGKIDKHLLNNILNGIVLKGGIEL